MRDRCSAEFTQHPERYLSCGRGRAGGAGRLAVAVEFAARPYQREIGTVAAEW